MPTLVSGQKAFSHILRKLMVQDVPSCGFLFPWTFCQAEEAQR